MPADASRDRTTTIARLFAVGVTVSLLAVVGRVAQLKASRWRLALAGGTLLILLPLTLRFLPVGWS